MLFSEPLLHPHTVEAQPVLSGDLMTLWEMVDLLVLIKTLVEITLAGGRAPKNIPLVRLGSGEPSCLQHRPDELVVEP